ncbi:MAG: prepilin peptidase, partial [Burkholderiaceae bacterium]
MLSLEAVQAGVFGIIGLLVGSFLNVVIYRLPKMMEKQWAEEVAEFKGETLADEAAFNLMLPRSKCPKCAHQIKWYENIPVLSYLFLRGKCSACKTAI